MAKVLIVEDHPIFRQGIKEVFANDAQFRVIGEAADAGQRGTSYARNDGTRLCLVLNLPGKSGLELLAELKQQHPKLPKLVLSQYPEDQYAMRVIRAGASGHLTKNRTPEELVEALTATMFF